MSKSNLTQFLLQGLSRFSKTIFFFEIRWIWILNYCIENMSSESASHRNISLPSCLLYLAMFPLTKYLEVYFKSTLRLTMFIYQKFKNSVQCCRTVLPASSYISSYLFFPSLFYIFDQREIRYMHGLCWLIVDWSYVILSITLHGV